MEYKTRILRLEIEVHAPADEFPSELDVACGILENLGDEWWEPTEESDLFMLGTFVTRYVEGWTS